jgi:spore germination cell wall hydrolase CwlJ-like protein
MSRRRQRIVAAMIAYADRNIAALGEDEVLARTIFAEARSEPEEGQIAIGYVIKYRAALAKAYVAKHGQPHRLFGDGTIAGACLASFRAIHQFSCWNEKDPNRAKALKADHSDPRFCRAHQIARDVIAGKAEDRLLEATHYYNPDVVRMPGWAKGLPFASIGHHRFFRYVP